MHFLVTSPQKFLFGFGRRLITSVIKTWNWKWVLEKMKKLESLYFFAVPKRNYTSKYSIKTGYVKYIMVKLKWFDLNSKGPFVDYGLGLREKTFPQMAVFEFLLHFYTKRFVFSPIVYFLCQNLVGKNKNFWSKNEEILVEKWTIFAAKRTKFWWKNDHFLA